MRPLVSQWERRANKKRIKRIRKELSFLAFQTDERIISKHERRLSNLILSLSRNYKEDNSALTQPFHLYLSGLYPKGRITLDKTAHNDSIEFFTDTLLNNVENYKAIFYYHTFQKVVQMMIMANLSIHRAQHANKLLEAYDSIFTQSYKAMLYIRILTATCGILDLKKVEDLFAQAKTTYEKECTTTRSKATFMKNLYVLSKGVNCRVPDMDELNHSINMLLLHDDSQYAASLYREYLCCNEYLKETEEWLSSLNEKSEACANRAVLLVRDLFESRKKGRKTLPISVERSEPNRAALGFRNRSIRANLQNKDYPLSMLLKDIDEGIDFYYKMARTSPDNGKQLLSSNLFFSLKLLRPSVEYWMHYEENFKKIIPSNPCSLPDTVFFFTNEYSLVNGAVTYPFLLEARRRGIKCFSMSPRIHLDDCNANDELYDLYGYCVGGQDNRFYLDKEVTDMIVDIPKKKILVSGLNVYQPIFEFITRYQFTYHYKYDTDAWARYRTTLLIRTFDRLFKYIKRIEEWAIRNNKKVYFISNAPHLHMAAAFRIYCEERGYKNGLFYLCTSPGYDNYFANASDPQSETTTALNLTTHPRARNSFLGTKEGFEDYYQRNKSRICEIRNKMQKYLEAQRGGERKYHNPDEKNRVIEIVRKSKIMGKKIILLNGKVIIDLAVKYTEGCVHSDMSEWITHAVRFAKSHSDKILLLIKPHPHENREDLTLTSEKIDNLRSLILTDLGENTIYLDNDMFSNHELIDYIDLGMVWNGTSALEFAAQGKKVLVADVWGHYDYPIGFVFPKSLEEYETYMLEPELLDEDPAISDRAIAFLEYMGSDDVRIANDYSQTTLMNFNQFETTVNAKAVDRLASMGDAKLEAYFDKVVNA